MDLPIDLGAPFAQGLQETLSISIVAKDRFAAVTAVHDVIDGPWDTLCAGGSASTDVEFLHGEREQA